MTLAVDATLAAATARHIYRRGVPVTFRRVVMSTTPPSILPTVTDNSTSPPTVTVGATVTVSMRDMTPDTTQTSESGISASQTGSVQQFDRFMIVMASDLAAASFPLLRQGDQIVLGADLGGETLSVVKADPAKRAIAGAIEVFAAGIG